MGEAAIRGALGISLEDLAEHLGCGRNTLNNYELNERDGVKTEGKRVAIARFYRGLESLVKRTRGTAKGKVDGRSTAIADARTGARRERRNQRADQRGAGSTHGARR